ncbi:MAG TPA: hypothetical protein PLP17_07280 [Oligoflexia bacterium]|nr:hypothetical protein [Oligoflexia bacterium]
MIPKLYNATILLAFIFSGCSEYWWTRGQVKSSHAIVRAAQARLSAQAASAPGELSSCAFALQHSVLDAMNSNSMRSSKAAEHERLAAIEHDTLCVSSLLSPGAQPAFAELRAQLLEFSALAAQGKEINSAGFDVWTARMLLLLAAELESRQNSAG